MNYKQKTEQLTKRFLALKQEGSIALHKDTTNLFRKRNQKTKKLNVKHFNHVISIDTERMTADVEGMTTYERLVNETLKHGLLPTVVPELKTITIGGACTGLGIESSSFKYGLVHETVEELDVLTGTGQITTCSPTKNADLFYGFPNSYGTLGYALRVRVKLTPCKKYVKLKHERFDNAKDFFAAMDLACGRKEADFIDGTIFSEKEHYLTLGMFVNTAPPTSDYTGKNIYYKSIKEKETDYLTTHDYIWRWDTDWFWCSKHFHVQNPFIRRVWGKKRLNSKTYMRINKFSQRHPFLGKLATGFKKTESIIQDIQIPINNCAAFIDFFHNTIGITPVWTCPIKPYNDKTYPLYPLDPDTLYINFGFWDLKRTDKEDGHYNKLIERKVEELGGKKSLYSTSYYSEKKFWELYNKPAYDKLKKKYDPDNTFPNLYQKCVLKK